MKRHVIDGAAYIIVFSFMDLTWTLLQLCNIFFFKKNNRAIYTYVCIHLDMTNCYILS